MGGVVACEVIAEGGGGVEVENDARMPANFAFDSLEKTKDKPSQ